jgi:hypothetical protein
LLDASPTSSLPISYLVEVLTERDAHLLDALGQIVEAKRRQLRSGEPRLESKNRESKNKDKA